MIELIHQISYLVVVPGNSGPYMTQDTNAEILLWPAK